MSAPIQVEGLVEELLIDIKDLEPEPASDQCCIFRVPKKIRCTNEKAYTPQLISIGPFHHDDTKLADMEKKKKWYMKCFLERITSEKRDKILNFIKSEEQKIRNCYAEVCTLKSHKFAMMIMYDAIFIIELFLRNNSALESASDSLLAIEAVTHTLYKDLELLENQLPYFVLEEIYRLANLSEPHIPAFMELSCTFFGSFKNLELTTLERGVTVKHFCDWRRITLLKGFPNSEPESNGLIKDLPSAVKLHGSGVSFKCADDRECLLDIKFVNVKRLIPCFNKHELQIPCLEIYDSTECQLRNIIALEQCHNTGEEQCQNTGDSPVCNYIGIMDHLIDTEKDVDLLVEKGIISNHLGDNASVAHMFNKLNENIHLRKSSSYICCEDLKAHYNNRWNKRKAILRSVYFSNPWRGAGTLAAIVLLLLTVIQTICSIKQVA